MGQKNKGAENRYMASLRQGPCSKRKMVPVHWQEEKNPKPLFFLHSRTLRKVDLG